MVGDGLGPSTVRNTVLPLRAIYRRALLRGLVVQNPTLGLSLPAHRPKRDRVARPAEAEALLRALTDSDRTLWATALYAGLRRGEVFECPADDELLGRFYERAENDSSIPGLVSGFKKLNEDLTALLDRHHTIGQSFFMATSYDRARLERTWRRQILPLIEDYLFDQPDLVAGFTLDKYWPPTA
jgi:hypothetical protein